MARSEAQVIQLHLRTGEHICDTGSERAGSEIAIVRFPGPTVPQIPALIGNLRVSQPKIAPDVIIDLLFCFIFIFLFVPYDSAERSLPGLRPFPDHSDDGNRRAKIPLLSASVKFKTVSVIKANRPLVFFKHPQKNRIIFPEPGKRFVHQSVSYFAAIIR